MALDTKYRPVLYGDVLGQEASVAVLKQFVAEGRGFHQSYVFCGQHGSGKTTLGRILARALLCESPVDGAPCDECSSCQTFLTGGSHECFEELDAATKSGKGDLARIIEDVAYSTVSGKRRIYLFDESHRLSKQALDALLKPMEDSAPGSEDKRLVCIFCTTEPEKMVSTIFSRCAPAFVVRRTPLTAIAQRLSYICEQENIEYEENALHLIAEQSGSHIRDAIKMLEGVSMLGAASRDNAISYLHLDANDGVLDLLQAVGEDLSLAVSIGDRLSRKMSPSGVYSRLADAAMLLYKRHLGVVLKVPLQWNSDQVDLLAERGGVWLNFAQRFAAPSHRPTSHTLTLDIAAAHHLPSAHPSFQMVVSTAEAAPVRSPSSTSTPQPEVTGSVHHNEPATPQAQSHTTPSGVFVYGPAVGAGPQDRSGTDTSEGSSGGSEDLDSAYLDPGVFRQLVRHHLGRLKRGRSGRKDMGGG